MWRVLVWLGVVVVWCIGMWAWYCVEGCGVDSDALVYFHVIINYSLIFRSFLPEFPTHWLTMRLMLLTSLFAIAETHPGGGGETGGIGEARHHSTPPSPLTLNYYHFHVHTNTDWATGVKENETAGGFSEETKTRILEVSHRAGGGGVRRTSVLGEESLLLHLKKSGKRRNRKRKNSDGRKPRRQKSGSEREGAVRVVVEGEAVESSLPHFWRSTGLR